MTTVRTVRSGLVRSIDRLDAGFHTSPGEAAAARLIATDRGISRLGDRAEAWTPSRFSRVWASPGEPSIPYLRPYDVFDFIPVAADRLSAIRTANLEALRLDEGQILITCSGRNLGPVALVGALLATFALSHDMVRLRLNEPGDRFWVFAYLRSPTGQALLRRGRAGSVIDHITVEDVLRLPVPDFSESEKAALSGLVSRASELRERARARLLSVMGNEPDAGSAAASSKAQWTMHASQLRDRLDAARYHPAAVAAEKSAVEAGGPLLGDLARASLVPRYRRFYVEPAHGRPVLSGRQLLQADPVNLRFVSDRAFRDPEEYSLRIGDTAFGAAGRAEGRIGQPALITEERAGWLASDDVMRLFPRDGVRPGTIWAAVASANTQAQLKSLTFGSVVDHMKPWDVERIPVSPIDGAVAIAAEEAWHAFADAAKFLTKAVDLIELLLAGNGAGWAGGLDSGPRC